MAMVWFRASEIERSGVRAGPVRFGSESGGHGQTGRTGLHAILCNRILPRGPRQRRRRSAPGARGFEQAYIAGVVTRGIPDTGMPSFATRLSRPDLVAVVAYVATLNGITDPNLGGSGPPATARSRPALTGEAVRGARLFTDAVRGFGRCSTCHEVGSFGLPVAAPIGNVPASVAALKALATPNVRTGSEAGESMPALVLSEGKQNTVFYDLSATPPVLRNAAPGSVKFVDGSNWHHTSAIGAYDDAELAAILTFLRAVIQP